MACSTPIRSVLHQPVHPLAPNYDMPALKDNASLLCDNDVVKWPCCSDGLISYDELLSYFLSANTSLRERFTHQFAEHTFLGNAVCEHCKGMVSVRVYRNDVMVMSSIHIIDEGNSEARCSLQGLWYKLS